MIESTQQLIQRLSEDLQPVRPLPRLRSGFAIVLTVWATLLGLVWLGSGEVAGLGSVLRDRIYGASFAGLLVAALGGTASALASGVPGRERVEWVGLVAAASGLLCAAGVCLIGMETLVRESPGGPPGLDAMCFRHAVLSTFLPAGVILSFMVRGWTSRPVRAALIALLGSGALGAALVHLNCGFLLPEHVLIGHLSVPVVLAALGAYPLAIILRRLRDS